LAIFITSLVAVLSDHVRHALRTRALLASANMRKTFDNVSYSSRAPHSATASRANILRWLSLPYHNMRLFRCGAPIFPLLSGGDETCLREPKTARERHPLSITRLQGSVNPSCHIFSGKPLPGATGQTAPLSCLTPFSLKSGSEPAPTLPRSHRAR
jgi:hypothetical protein